jgi:hypothetical protein
MKTFWNFFKSNRNMEPVPPTIPLQEPPDDHKLIQEALARFEEKQKEHQAKLKAANTAGN